MAETESAVFKVHIRGSIDDVWREITKTDELQQCMFNMRLHTPGLAVGAPMQMRSANGKYAGVVGEVLVFDPPHHYGHTFRFTHLDDPPCKVFYDLNEVEDGVEFLLRLEDIPVGTKTANQMKQGGNMIVNTLKRVVETGKPSFGTRLLFVLFKVMGLFQPKSTRVENWPLEATNRS